MRLIVLWVSCDVVSQRCMRQMLRENGITYQDVPFWRASSTYVSWSARDVGFRVQRVPSWLNRKAEALNNTLQ